MLLNFLLLLLACPAIILGEPAEEFAISLGPDTFDTAIKENNYFIMFYAPWCGHCKRLYPVWEQLAELMNVEEDDPSVLIGRVDCTEHQELCNKHEIIGYPTLRFYNLKKPGSVKFQGTRELPALTDFIDKQLGREKDRIKDLEKRILADKLGHNRLLELTESNFAKHVSSGIHFVKFYAPWCSHCQRMARTWEDLAWTLQEEHRVQIAKIDCTIYRPICQDFDIRGYPSLLWIQDGKKIDKYTGGRSLEELQKYVMRMLKRGSNENEFERKGYLKEDKDYDGGVVSLTADEFEYAIGDGLTFVKFYAPWCGHCQKLSPLWDDLAFKIHAKNQRVTIAKVDCTVSINKELCQNEKVEGYPALVLYKDGEKQSEYNGARSFDDLHNFVVHYTTHDEL